jgi:histidine-containing phosphotransfer protein
MCSSRLRPEDLTGSGWWQEVLDQQFTQLQQLQDESNPEFVSEVVSLFFEDSERLLEELTESL